MTSYKNLVKTSRALWFVVVCSFVLLGCAKEEANPADSSVPENYMKDPAFRAKLDVQDGARKDIMRQRMALKKQLDEIRVKEPTSPKIAELEAAVRKCESEFETNRLETLSIVRERLRGKPEVK